jgi:Ni/Fe-hydrogenase subunit HybB-like protein
MFGWYVFASWFVSGLAAITLVTVMLKEMGYLKLVNENHLHDMGKFVFAFSIFWTYIWFSQFLLIYYANIPEETIYFVDRLKSDYYSKFFFINLIMNFFFPFLVLMTRDAKRKMTMLKIVCTVVLAGHWIDFYLMITPGTLKANGGFGFLEIGLAMVYLSAFAYVIFNGLTKRGLVAQNHPMLEESIHHSC